MKARGLRIAVAALLLAIMAGPAGAQGRGGIPVPPLLDQPWEYQTANARIRVRVLTAGLENPWSLESGTIIRITPSCLDVTKISPDDSQH